MRTDCVRPVGGIVRRFLRRRIGCAFFRANNSGWNPAGQRIGRAKHRNAKRGFFSAFFVVQWSLRRLLTGRCRTVLSAMRQAAASGSEAAFLRIGRIP